MLTPLAMGRMPNQAIFGQMAPGITASQTGQNRAIGGGLEAIFGQKGMFPIGQVVQPALTSAWEGLFGSGGMFANNQLETGGDWAKNTSNFTNDTDNWGYL
jgi:phage tail tape-measure protein